MTLSQPLRSYSICWLIIRILYCADCFIIKFGSQSAQSQEGMGPWTLVWSWISGTACILDVDESMKLLENTAYIENDSTAMSVQSLQRALHIYIKEEHQIWWVGWRTRTYAGKLLIELVKNCLKGFHLIFNTPSNNLCHSCILPQLHGNLTNSPQTAVFCNVCCMYVYQIFPKTHQIKFFSIPQTPKWQKRLQATNHELKCNATIDALKAK